MMILRFMAIFAELESSMKSSRVRDAHAVRRTQGKIITGKAEWYHDHDEDGRVILKDEAKDLARQVYQMNQQGLSRLATREILEEQHCKKNNIPYRKSAFHKRNISEGSVSTLAKIGFLLASGVEEDKVLLAMHTTPKVVWG
jgi:DNA invertase Pin-like site-specific DNA recombinase